MYDYLDTDNQTLSSGYPEHEAVFNSSKRELTAFYRGAAVDTWQYLASIEEAEQLYGDYIARLEEDEAV